MIVVVGRAVTDDARREDFIRIAQAVARASRGEDGCRSYRVYEDTERPNEFVFVEEWESTEALVFCELLEWRAAGAHGGAAFP